MALAIYHVNKLLDAQAMTATFQSSPIDTKNFKGYSIQLVATGSPVGTYTLQCSNDPDILNITNWCTISNSAQIINGSGDIFYNVTDAFYMFVRVVYTFGSGSGNVTARVMLKD